MSTDFAVWKKQLAIELSEVFAMSPVEAEDYIKSTGDECWQEAFNDSLTPKEAAAEEAWAALMSQ